LIGHLITSIVLPKKFWATHSAGGPEFYGLNLLLTDEGCRVAMDAYKIKTQNILRECGSAALSQNVFKFFL
jgi:hypothetical protein